MALRPLRVGSFVQLDDLTGRWVQSGYEPVQVVEEPGTFARRGGIVDIWPPNLSHPVRIDLFGDEVETLRAFDPTTQRSERQLEKVLIGPGSEAIGGALSAPRNQLRRQFLHKLGPDRLPTHKAELALERLQATGRDPQRPQRTRAALKVCAKPC